MSTKRVKVSFSSFVDGYCDVEDQLHDYVLRKAERFFADEKSEKLGIVDRKRFEERRKRIQKHFLKAIGGLPEEKTPLNPKVRGIIEKEKYRIEKIIYESLPHFYVTSLLYVPKETKERMPGVLFVCGHSRPAKASTIYQKVCIDLVKNGFTVLAIDPLGQGERLQYWDSESESEIVRWGTTEHSYMGLQCSLTGDDIARYFIWDGTRGIDYLTSRKEVDEERIGVTGNSGGGTQTAYLMMTEPRIRAAAPCCYITSIDAVMKTIGPQDAEQNIFGAVKEGLNHDDYITASAPKPALIGAAAYDFFPIEGVLQTFERAKNIYRLYNAEENVAIHIGNHTHAYSDELREAVVNWFKVHLKNEPPNFKTGEAPVEPEESLNVTESGQILGEKMDARTLFDLNIEHWNEKKPMRPPIRGEDELKQYVNKIRLELKSLLNIEETGEPIYPRTISTINIGDLKAEKIFFFSEPGITLTAIMIYDADVKEKAPPVLALFEDGTNEIESESTLIRSLAAEGNKLLVLDTRGIGGVKVRKLNSRDLADLHGTEYKITYDSLMLGTSLMGMRTFDVLRGMDYLRSRRDVDIEQLHLYAKGRAAIYGLFAAALNPEVKAITLHDMLYSYENIVRTRIYDRKYSEHLLVHGILEHFDLVDLLPSIHDRDYRFINLRNAEQKTVSLDELENRWFEVVEKHYPILGNIQKRVVFHRKCE